jgi:hypothetical protein
MRHGPEAQHLIWPLSYQAGTTEGAGLLAGYSSFLASQNLKQIHLADFTQNLENMS